MKNFTKQVLQEKEDDKQRYSIGRALLIFLIGSYISALIFSFIFDGSDNIGLAIGSLEYIISINMAYVLGGKVNGAIKNKLALRPS